MHGPLLHGSRWAQLPRSPLSSDSTGNHGGSAVGLARPSPGASVSLPTPPQLPMRAGLQRIGVYFTPWAAALAVAVALYSSDTHRSPSRPSPPPPIDGALPLQQWATDAVPNVVSSVLMGTLPSPDPRQRKPPCDPDVEREFSGYCWVALKVPPPCPKGKAWEQDGACYAFALSPARLPSSGDFRPTGVAGEPQ